MDVIGDKEVMADECGKLLGRCRVHAGEGGVWLHSLGFQVESSRPMFRILLPAPMSTDECADEDETKWTAGMKEGEPCT